MEDKIDIPEQLGDMLLSKKMKDAARKANQERSEANSRRKLEGVIKKKCQTTMIGALARFEERFGGLWGHGRPLEDLSEEELIEREKWDITRTEVLNNGNNQLRAIQEELSRYVVNYEGYSIKMICKPPQMTVVREPNKETNDE